MRDVHALAPLGPVQFELIEPLEDDTIYDEFLPSGKRPGVAFAYMDKDPLTGIIMVYVER